VRHDLAPWTPRLNINRDSGSNAGGSGGGLFQQTQMFGRLNTPGWPDDHNLAVTTSVDSDEDEGQSFGISPDHPLFFAQAYFALHSELRHRGMVVNSKKIRRLMREHDLQPKRRRRFVARLREMS
jgi:hypothetical protein